MVPISNEKHLNSDLANSIIYGIIKISVDSTIPFKKSSDRDAYIALAKSFGDTMFKCYERIDYYESLFN